MVVEEVLSIVIRSEKVEVPDTVPDKVGFVKVLLVNVSVVSLPTNVSVEEGNVRVTSPVEAGPINVALLVPFPESS